MVHHEISPSIQNNVSINNNQAANPFLQNFGSLAYILFSLMHSNQRTPQYVLLTNFPKNKNKKCLKSDPLINSSSLSYTGGSTCKSGWSQDHPDLQKNCICTLVKKELYVKITYCDHLNKNIEQPELRITKSQVQQK